MKHIWQAFTKEYNVWLHNGQYLRVIIIIIIT